MFPKHLSLPEHYSSSCFFLVLAVIVLLRLIASGLSNFLNFSWLFTFSNLVWIATSYDIMQHVLEMGYQNRDGVYVVYWNEYKEKLRLTEANNSQ